MRTPKPYFKKSHKAWYVNLHGKNVRLGEDEETAWQEYHILMARGKEIKPPTPVQAVFGLFLEWVKDEKSAGTYRFYKAFLDSFGKFIGPKLNLGDLRPYHVNNWIKQAYPKAGSTHKHNAVRAVKRAFAWAVKEGRIERSPLANMVNEHKLRRREYYIQPAEFDRLLEAADHASFRDVLVMLRRTGCRPKELRDAEARHFDKAKGVLDFPIDESKGRKECRVVVLDVETRAIVERLALKHPEGPLFRNYRKRPWTKDAMALRFNRLSDELGFKVTPYTLRHVFATEALSSGVPLAMVAALMGHKDYKMLQDVYGHLEKKSDELRAALEMAIASVKSNAS